LTGIERHKAAVSLMPDRDPANQTESSIRLQRRAFFPLLLLPVFAPLIACQESAGGLAANIPVVRAPEVPITILAIDGIPEAINESMLNALSDAATRRGMQLVEADKKPRYQIKGYFSAGPNGAGTELSYVWDVLDTESQQSSRVEGSANTPRRGAEPWSVMDSATQTALAGTSMNDLAGFLARGGTVSQ
jgi:hypothetical protein